VAAVLTGLTVAMTVTRAVKMLPWEYNLIDYEK
jgi:hypothetical protein